MAQRATSLWFENLFFKLRPPVVFLRQRTVPCLTLSYSSLDGTHSDITSCIYYGSPEGLSDARKTCLPTIGPHGMAPVDAGNLMDRGPEEYYVSEVLPIPAGISKTAARWEGTIPDSCWVRIQFRSGFDLVSLSETAWSDWYGEGANDFKAAPQDCLLQYRLALGARCSCGTPRITSVVIDIERAHTALLVTHILRQV